MHGRAIRMEHFRRPEASLGRSYRSALRCNKYVTIKKRGIHEAAMPFRSLKNVSTAIFRNDLIALSADPKVLVSVVFRRYRTYESMQSKFR